LNGVYALCRSQKSNLQRLASSSATDGCSNDAACRDPAAEIERMSTLRLLYDEDRHQKLVPLF